MISYIIKLLRSDDYLGLSNEIEIAKGLYQISDNRKTLKRKIKRKWQTKHIR